jgi:transcriptional regulator with XRE-family HTH domain
MRQQKKYPARYRKDREYESNIHIYRVAQGLTVAQLAELASISINLIFRLANGTDSPLYEMKRKCGQLKPYAQKLCEVLRAEPSDLFPRYFCKIVDNSAFDNIPYRTYSELCANYFDEQLIIKDYVTWLIHSRARSLGKRGLKILVLHYYHNETLTDIAVELNLSPGRVRQLLVLAVRKLRCTAAHDFRGERRPRGWPR